MNKDTNINLYIDLLRKTLSYSLWPQPLVPIDEFIDSRFTAKNLIIRMMALVFKNTRVTIAKKTNYSDFQIENGLVWPGLADTMIGNKRLINVQNCVQTVLDEDIEGDLIETGVWRGGCTIFMKGILKANNINDRKVYVADSFRGLPKPNETDHPADKNDKHYTEKYLIVSRNDVEDNFKRYDLLDDNVIFLEGWFNESLKNADIDKLSILRLDGDMYGSTIDVLEELYPKLSIGGYCIIDDYHIPGCKKAVDDYREKKNISIKIERIDQNGIFWRKM